MPTLGLNAKHAALSSTLAERKPDGLLGHGLAKTVFAPAMLQAFAIRPAFTS
jgi:hypothetical protein